MESEERGTWPWVKCLFGGGQSPKSSSPQSLPGSACHLRDELQTWNSSGRHSTRHPQFTGKGVKMLSICDTGQEEHCCVGYFPHTIGCSSEGNPAGGPLVSSWQGDKVTCSRPGGSEWQRAADPGLSWTLFFPFDHPAPPYPLYASFCPAFIPAAPQP